MQDLRSPVVMIHQPYFLPWLGYFAKLALADTFVVLDDVFFRKRFYIDRARIIDVHSSIRWIGLPVGQNFRTPINEIRIRDIDFLNDMIETVRSAYRRSPMFTEEMNWVDWVLRESVKVGATLAQVDMDILMRFCDRLQVRRPVVDFSSRHSVRKDPSERLLDLVQVHRGRTFLTGAGSSAAVHNFDLLSQASVDVVVQDFLHAHPEYRQVRRQYLPFEPGLSVLDALMNVGHSQTKHLIDQGVLDSNYDVIHSMG